MGNQLFVVVLSLVTIFSFLYKYTGDQYVNISEKNQVIGTLESNFLPYNKIVKEGYTINCIIGEPISTDIANKQKTIVYFLNGTTPLSFDCTKPFYKETGFHRSNDPDKVCKSEADIITDIATLGGSKVECNATLRIQELYSRTSHQCIIDNTETGFDVQSCAPRVLNGSMLGDGYTICGTTFGTAIFGCTTIQI